MKWVFVIIALLGQLVATGAAMAVTVDFSGVITTDITNSSYPIGGISFRYDDFASGVDFATIGPSGIFGTTGGVLVSDFSTPATALNVGFSLLDAVSTGPQIPDALTALFYSGGTFLDFVSVAADFSAYDPTVDPTFGLAIGTLAYSGPAFDQALMYFSLDAPFFTVDSVSYQPVPEPGTFLLLVSSLIGLGSWRIFRRRVS